MNGDDRMKQGSVWISGEEEGYLSDLELEQLIGLIEQQELVAAPPDLKTKILAETGLNQMKTSECRITEFRQYCVRVWTSVAVAILLVFMLPFAAEQIEAEWMDRNMADIPGFCQEKQSWEQQDEARVPIRDYLFSIFQ